MLRDIRKSMRHLSRYQEILKVFVKYGFWDVVTKIKIGLIPDLTKKVLPQIEKKDLAILGTPERLRMAFEELGTTFIKLGQMLSVRPDLIPPEIAQEFSKLQDDVAAEPFEKVESTLIKEYKKPLSDVFSEFDKTPMEIGNLTIRDSEKIQIHRMRLNINQMVLLPSHNIAM